MTTLPKASKKLKCAIYDPTDRVLSLFLKRSNIPLGIWLILDHSEACAITDGRTVNAITSLLPATWWAAALAVVIYAQSAYIRKKNENSGGKGVKLLYHFAVGVIVYVKRRGDGSSPCPAMLVGEGRVEEVDLMPLPLFEATPEQLESLKSDAGGFVS